jgi:hypothetical protein
MGGMIYFTHVATAKTSEILNRASIPFDAQGRAASAPPTLLGPTFSTGTS